MPNPPTEDVPTRANQPGLGRPAKAQTDPAPYGHDDRLGPVPSLSAGRKPAGTLPAASNRND